MNIHNRQKGTLFGLAVGDALGAAVEFRPPGSFPLVTDYRDGGPHMLDAGEWTDDTSLALALADSMANGWDLNDQISRYVEWRRDGKYSVNGFCFDIGSTTATALRNFEEHGMAETAASRDEHAAGNGSIMRLAPVPIYYYDLYPHDVDDLAGYAAQSSLTTHCHRTCLSSCRYMAVVLAALINGESKEKALLGDFGLNIVPEVQKVADGSFKRLNPPEIKGSGYVVKSLEAALWAFYSSNDYEEAVLKAVNLGDDSDTTGAVCGQLAGAYWGYDGIPERWRQNLAKKEVIEEIFNKLLQ
jgi:ADP-ribosylglycohydrolase